MESDCLTNATKQILMLTKKVRTVQFIVLETVVLLDAKSHSNVRKP